MRYVLLGMGLLLLVGCGESSGSSDVNADVTADEDVNQQKNSDVTADGNVTRNILTDTAVTTDAFELITIAPDSDARLTLEDGETFVLRGSTPEKMLVQGKFTITSN